MERLKVDRFSWLEPRDSLIYDDGIVKVNFISATNQLVVSGTDKELVELRMKHIQEDLAACLEYMNLPISEKMKRSGINFGALGGENV